MQTPVVNLFGVIARHLTYMNINIVSIYKNGYLNLKCLKGFIKNTFLFIDVYKTYISYSKLELLEHFYVYNVKKFHD